jgi:hypothetical protein
MYFNSSYKLYSSGHAHLTSDQILIYNKTLRHKSTSCLNENKIENNARPRQPRHNLRKHGALELHLVLAAVVKLRASPSQPVARGQSYASSRRCRGPQSVPELHMVVALELHLVLSRARARPVVLTGTGGTRPRAMALIVAQILAQQQTAQ